MEKIPAVFNPIDREVLRDRVRTVKPFPHFCIDNFLTADFAEEVWRAFPSFEEAGKIGRKFAAVNEKEKVQVTDSKLFAAPVAELNKALASPEFRGLLSHVFDIPNLLSDDELVGGGIHETGPRGHLDVHVDFNYIEDRQLHRRLNILIYFNKNWQDDWGGNIELWDPDVTLLQFSALPRFNRCVVFATSEISFHGVTAVKCPPGESRKSFAAYYYTREAPPNWDGKAHSTIFRARPDEVMKGAILMPMENAKRKVVSAFHDLKKTIKG